jgi:hypothetical protein
VITVPPRDSILAMALAEARETTMLILEVRASAFWG